MNTSLLLLQLCIIGCKIIHIYSPADADNKSLELTMNVRHKFGVDVWTHIIRQAVEGMTESELFLPIIQKAYEYTADEGADPLLFIQLIDSKINDVLKKKLNISSEQLLLTENLYTEKFKFFLSSVLDPSVDKKFKFSTGVIKGWHDSEPIEHFQQFQRLRIVEEIIFNKIFQSAGFPSGISDQTVTESELALYDRLKGYLKKNSIILWETYASNEAVYSIPMDITSIMSDNQRSKDFCKILKKHLQSDDTIVCMFNEYTVLYELDPITVSLDLQRYLYSYTEDIYMKAIKALTEAKYCENCTKFKISLGLSNNLVQVLEKRHYDIHGCFNNELVLGDVTEQKLWIELHQKMRDMISNAFE